MTKEYIAHIESNGKGWYSVYCEEQFPFGFFGEGATIEEAKQDFLTTFDAFRDNHHKKTGEYIEATFTFVMDISAVMESSLKKIKVLIEQDDNGMILATPQHEYKVGLYGYGQTEEVAMEDLYSICEEAREFCPNLPRINELEFDIIHSK